MTSDEQPAVLPIGDDDLLSDEGFAALGALGAEDDEVTQIESLSDEDWLARNPTLADSISETAPRKQALPSEATKTLELDSSPTGGGNLDKTEALPPTLPASLPPTPAAQTSKPAPKKAQPGGIPPWGLGLGTVAVAAVVFFTLTSGPNEEVAPLSPPAAPAPVARATQETPPTPQPDAPADKGAAPKAPSTAPEETKTEPAEGASPAAEASSPASGAAADSAPASPRKPVEETAKPEPAQDNRKVAEPKTPAPPKVNQEPKAPAAPPPTEEVAKAPVKLAAAAPNSANLKCPKGMKKISEGGFKFGSASSDPMRNFGEKLLSGRKTHAYCIDYYEYPNGAKAKPSVGVSWNKAKTSCEAKGKRLCTELEWERACKGPSNSRFPYGNSWNPSACNTEDAEGIPGTLARAFDFKKCRSGYRVYMMAGNAEEWTADSYAQGSSNKVVKGGAANRPDWASRCAARRAQNPRTSATLLGFRCCADPR